MAIPFFSSAKPKQGALPGEALLTPVFLTAAAMLVLAFCSFNTLLLSGLAKEPIPLNAAKMLCLVNTERKNNGLSALAMDDSLAESAEFQSRAQAHVSIMSHLIRGEPVLEDRIAKASGEKKWVGMGENVAYGWPDEEYVMKRWMNSPGHRANILGKFTHIGVALAFSANGTKYWTQNFGNNGQKSNFPLCPGYSPPAPAPAPATSSNPAKKSDVEPTAMMAPAQPSSSSDRMHASANVSAAAPHTMSPIPQPTSVAKAKPSVDMHRLSTVHGGHVATTATTATTATAPTPLAAVGRSGYGIPFSDQRPSAPRVRRRR
ncbi:CAP domain-containing protein [Thamnocephalis sphaerospora]|uniref:CAP domain-containing protein n=1 Tax=Thamnocephalis sphaerospora TaxID=78915 RepID=A0A4P9XNG7_9FUNG|nr:CAP domain-containing protein [Thamnocephalis sphaerospora]|eukprot:RKP07504.1 CAP domain-containing protein [Thamnocephalis sphaerospora]